MREGGAGTTKEVPEENIFLHGPDSISPDEVEREEREHHSKFSDQEKVISVGHHNGKPYFMIEIFDSLPEELDTKEKRQFIQMKKMIDGEKRNVYFLIAGHPPALDGEEPEKNPRPYHIAQPRNIRREMHEAGETELPTPKNMEPKELIAYLRTHNIVFYTGAGISIAGGVKGMAEHRAQLGLETELGKANGFVLNALRDPQKILDTYEDFTTSAYENPPTPAHRSIATLAKLTNSPVLTENIDLLHEHSGIRPINLSGPWLEDNVKPEWLKKVEAIVTVGLSHDDRGFLAWYKEHNPEGKIIAIDIKRPSYIGEGDALIEDDAQQLLPQLEKMVFA